MPTPPSSSINLLENLVLNGVALCRKGSNGGAFVRITKSAEEPTKTPEPIAKADDTHTLQERVRTLESFIKAQADTRASEVRKTIVAKVAPGFEIAPDKIEAVIQKAQVAGFADALVEVLHAGATRLEKALGTSQADPKGGQAPSGGLPGTVEARIAKHQTEGVPRTQAILKATQECIDQATKGDAQAAADYLVLTSIKTQV